MRTLLLIAVIYLLPHTSYAQTDTGKSADSFSYQDVITLSEINGVDVFDTDNFNDRIQKILQKNKLTVDDPNDHPNVYFTNNTGGKYLKITGGPDLGYGWFFTIGYTKGGKCSDCGTFIGIDKVPDFIVDRNIKLGDTINAIWDKAHLNYFRKFTLNNIVYYYFEKGIAYPVPFTPNYIFFYKFLRGRLIEIGLGYGMIGQNPMLHPK